MQILLFRTRSPVVQVSRGTRAARGDLVTGTGPGAGVRGGRHKVTGGRNGRERAPMTVAVLPRILCASGSARGIAPPGRVKAECCHLHANRES